jgi:release factor glutamine methyltransferase
VDHYPENEKSAEDQDVWTVQRILTWSAAWLKAKQNHPSCNARLDAELLLASVFASDRMNLYLQLDRPLTKSERDDFKNLLLRRGQGEPIAYILGYRDFYRQRFIVSKDVLIPRPDTELLVESALNFAKSRRGQIGILDIGTGSGCVAISIAAELPQALVEAWDISEAALDNAQKNAKNLEVHNLSFKACDGLALDQSHGLEFDLIVSNPPYIASDEIALLSPETLAFEPRLALFCPKQNGFSFYEAFAKNAGQALKPGGRIFLEVGVNQSAKVAQLFEGAGWGKILIEKDLSGHGRVVSAEKP